jgi:hypothetical protein
MGALLLALLVSPVATPVIAFARSIGRRQDRTEQVVPARSATAFRLGDARR